MIIVDGKDCILGRIGAYVAKELLKGESVVIYNCEQIRITGNPRTTVKKWVTRLGVRDIAKPSKNPKFPRRPDYFVKRSIRGMLPYRTKRGLDAYRHLKIFMEEPEEYTGKGKKIGELKTRNKSMTVEQLCKRLGWKG